MDDALHDIRMVNNPRYRLERYIEKLFSEIATIVMIDKACPENVRRIVDKCQVALDFEKNGMDRW